MFKWVWDLFGSGMGGTEEIDGDEEFVDQAVKFNAKIQDRGRLSIPSRIRNAYSFIKQGGTVTVAVAPKGGI